MKVLDEYFLSISSLVSEDDQSKRQSTASLSKDYPHPDDHDKRIIDTPWLKPFIMALFVLLLKRVHFLANET